MTLNFPVTVGRCKRNAFEMIKNIPGKNHMLEDGTILDRKKRYPDIRQWIPLSNDLDIWLVMLRDM